MRIWLVASAVVGLAAPAAALAQAAKNTPEGIVCAITGSCDVPAVDGDRMTVGDEKAFSLARPNAARPATPAPSPRATAPRAAPSRAHARPMVATRRVAPAQVRPDGGLDMLVTFGVGSAEMTAQARAETIAFAQAMAAPQMAGLRFAIEGHTDASGSRQTNMSLSQARAQAVADFLVAQGVDSSRLMVKGYGPDRPIKGIMATSPANRRVEFVKQT